MSRPASAAAPVLFGIGAAAAALACACNVPPGLDRQSDWEEAQPGLFSIGPYIVLGSAGTAYVSLKDEGIPAPVVDWWVQPEQAHQAGGAATAAAPPQGAMKSVTAHRNEDMWVAELRQLPVGPAIRYRVRSAVGTTPAFQFRVGVEKDKRFRFAVFGDTRSGHSVHRSIVEALDREQVDFAVHTGDMVEQGGRQDQWARFFQIERPLLVDTPMMPLVGNHDVSGRDYFRHYFLHALWAGNEHYFVRDWGQLRIVGVDSGVECREGCSQYFFAERALAEGERQGKLMVLALHYPPYSSGEHGSSADVQGPISTLARRHGVELVLTGHDHDYERTKPIDGTTYVVTGSSGAPIRPVTPRWFTAEARTEPHYVLVDVEAKRLILRAVNLAGETFDTAVIDENPPHK